MVLHILSCSTIFRFSFLLWYSPSKAFHISNVVFLPKRWGTMRSFTPSKMINIALESNFFHLAHFAGSVGATFMESMCSSASLTSRILVILYFHVGKFWAPWSLSSTLNCTAILKCTCQTLDLQSRFVSSIDLPLIYHCWCKSLSFSSPELWCHVKFPLIFKLGLNNVFKISIDNHTWISLTVCSEI